MGKMGREKIEEEKGKKERRGSFARPLFRSFRPSDAQNSFVFDLFLRALLRTMQTVMQFPRGRCGTRASLLTNSQVSK